MGHLVIKIPESADDCVVFNDSTGKMSFSIYDSETETILLSMHCITDLIKIFGLKKLKKLYLVRNEIEKITPDSGIARLFQLTELHLSVNFISSITGISKLVQLEVLELKRNKLVSIIDLQSLCNLKTLNLSSNLIDSMVGLSSLISLKNLDLSDNLIKIVEEINNLKLTVLDLSVNPIENMPELDLTVMVTILITGDSVSLQSGERMTIFYNEIAIYLREFFTTETLIIGGQIDS